MSKGSDKRPSDNTDEVNRLRHDWAFGTAEVKEAAVRRLKELGEIRIDYKLWES